MLAVRTPDLHHVCKRGEEIYPLMRLRCKIDETCGAGCEHQLAPNRPDVEDRSKSERRTYIHIESTARAESPGDLTVMKNGKGFDQCRQHRPAKVLLHSHLVAWLEDAIRSIERVDSKPGRVIFVDEPWE